MAPVTKTIHFQNGTIINANNSISRPLSIAKQGKDLTAQLAEDIAEEMADDPSLQELLDATHEQMLAWAQYEITISDLKSAVAKVQEMASNDEVSFSTDLEAVLNPEFERIAGQKKDAVTLKKTDTWKEYIAKVNEIVNPEGLGRNNKDDDENDDGDDSDEEMLVTQAELNPNCPITRKPFVKPMKNKKCNHTYDQEGIDMLLAQRPSFKCPVPACCNKDPVFERDLEVDRRMMRILKAKQKSS